MINLSEAQILAWITPLLWPFLRALALLATVPVFSQRAVPMRVKIGLAGFIALAAQPSLPAMPVVPLDSPLAFMVVAQQVLVGVTMGFAVRLVFAAVEMGGELIGLQMGLNFAGFFDPATASQGTASSRLFGTLVATDAPGVKLVLGLWIALPLVGMLLFVNLVLGVISRVAPQISVFSVGFPITVTVGLIGMLLTLPLMEMPFTMALQRMVEQFQ